ncbi:hypothetical protein L208DRAFT_1410429 [Tricholoma matsutake]|nr:hypothetical protein L208DRAFT_1410429 [Tricholoma matsutake 945]
MQGRGGWGMRSGVGVIAHPSSHASIAIASCTHHPPYEQRLVGMGMGAVVIALVYLPSTRRAGAHRRGCCRVWGCW